jgi:hypothetical protein
VRTRAVEDEDEFAIFRFTLGIPGFDDEDIPRAVGALGALGLCAKQIRRRYRWGVGCAGEE